MTSDQVAVCTQFILQMQDDMRKDINQQMKEAQADLESKTRSNKGKGRGKGRGGRGKGRGKRQTPADDADDEHVSGDGLAADGHQGLGEEAEPERKKKQPKTAAKKRARKDKKHEDLGADMQDQTLGSLPSAASDPKAEAGTAPRKRTATPAEPKPAATDAKETPDASNAHQEDGTPEEPPKKASRPRISEECKAARIEYLRAVEKEDPNFHVPRDIAPNKMSWTVYTPEFPTPVNEEDSREKLSPIQVLLVGNFYVNAVSEDRAAQVNKVHGTTIKVDTKKKGSTLSWGIYDGPAHAWKLAKQLAQWEPVESK